MSLLSQFSGSNTTTGRSAQSTPFILNGGIVNLPITLSSNISTVTPPETPIGPIPEFVLNGSIVTLPITLSSNISTVTPPDTIIGATPEFVLNGSLVTLPISLSSSISNVVI